MVITDQEELDSGFQTNGSKRVNASTNGNVSRSQSEAASRAPQTPLNGLSVQDGADLICIGVPDRIARNPLQLTLVK